MADERWTSRDDLAAIVEALGDGVVAMDPAGTLIFANQAAAQLFGFDRPDEALAAGGAAILERFEFFDSEKHPVEPRSLAGVLQRAAESPQEVLLGCRMRGERALRWFLVRSHAVHDEHGALRSSIAILRDVTGARAAEEALRGANEALRALLRASPLATVVLEMDGTIRLWNPAAERIFGWAEEELLGRRPPIIPPGSEKEFLRQMERLAQGHEIPPLETKRLTRGGELIDVTIWATSLVSPEGSPQVMAIVADASEARRAATERERLLRRIETERNFLRVILEQLPVGARIADAEGRVIFANRQVRTIWRAEGEPRWLGFRPDGRAYDDREWPIFRSLATEASFEEELEILRGDGTSGTLIVNSAPVRDEDGAVVGAVSILSDITERKRQEMRSRFLADASRLLTSSLDHREMLRTVAQLVVPWLADWCAVHLVRKDGSIGTVTIAHRDPRKRQWAEQAAPEYRPDQNASHGVANVIRTGTVEVWESIPDQVLREAAGDERTLEMLRGLGIRCVLIVPLAGRQRTLGAMTFISAETDRGFDATDRELAEELGRRAGLAVENAILFRKESDAREAAERAARRTATLQGFAEALSEAATEEWIADVVVETGLKHLGADAGSLALLRGDAIHVMRSIGYRRSVEERWPFFPVTADLPIARAVREKRIVTYCSLEELFESFPAMTQIAKWTHKSFAAVPLLVESRAIGAIGLSFLEPRRFDREEVELMLAVARQCAQALERARLLDAERAARAEAEAANRAKDEFLATLSHELRTPMTATLGWARMLTMLNVDQETLRLAIDSIYRSTQTQARIVDDLLDVARIVTGKMKIEPRPMLLRGLVLEALESVRAAADARSIAIAVDLPDPPVPVLGDPDRLRQVIWNLLSNAIKFTHSGGHVTIRLERDALQARLTVSDDGLGIRPELLPVIFERFRQGDSSSSRAAAGLGLGLSIVKHLVELHGGTVAAQSAGEGLGSSFTISIPIAAREIVEPVLAAPQPDRVLAGRSLLIVDDEQDTCLMIASTLRQFGADVRTAASAAEAISLLKAARPHLVVSDLAMPGLDGFALADRIRGDGDVELPLVALTAYGRPEDHDRALAAGFTAYLRKPVDPEVLVQSICALLAKE